MMNFNPLFIGQISTAGTSLGTAKLSKPNYLFSDIIKVILEEETDLNSLPKIELTEFTESDTTITPAKTELSPEINLLPVKKLSSDFAELNTKEITTSTEINLQDEQAAEFEFDQSELHSLFISLTGKPEILSTDNVNRQPDQITKLVETAENLKSNETLLVSVEGLEEPLHVEIKHTQNPFKDFLVKFILPQSSETETTTTENNFKNIEPLTLPKTKNEFVSEFSGIKNLPGQESNDIKLSTDFIRLNDGAAEILTDQKIVDEKIISVKSETTTTLKEKDFQTIPVKPGIKNVEEKTSVITKGSNINIDSDLVLSKNLKTRIDGEIPFKKDFFQDLQPENISKFEANKSIGIKESFEILKNTSPDINKTDSLYKNLEYPRKQSENKITIDLNPGINTDKNSSDVKSIKESISNQKSDIHTKENTNKNFVPGTSSKDEQFLSVKSKVQDIKIFTENIKPEFAERNNSAETQKIVRLQITKHENINVRDLIASVQKTDVKVNRPDQNPDIKNRISETNDLHSKLEKDSLRVSSKVDLDKNAEPKKEVKFPGSINTAKEDSFIKLSGLDKPVLNHKVVDKSLNALHSQPDVNNKTTYTNSTGVDLTETPEITKDVKVNSLKNNLTIKTFVETGKTVLEKSFSSEPDTVNNEKVTVKEEVKNSVHPDPAKSKSSADETRPINEQHTSKENIKPVSSNDYKNFRRLNTEINPGEEIQLPTKEHTNPLKYVNRNNTTILPDENVERELISHKEVINILNKSDQSRDNSSITVDNQIQSKPQNNLNLKPEEELPVQFFKSEKKISSEVELKNENSNSDSTVSEKNKIKNTLTENNFTSADENKNKSESQNKNIPALDSVRQSEQKVKTKDQSLKEVVASENKIDQAARPDLKEPNFVSKEKITADTKQLNETFKTIRSSEIVKEIENFSRQGETKTITFKVVPESLGKIKVSLDVTELTAKATIEVETETVKQIVQSNIETLKQSLTQNGITVSTINVSLNGSYQKQNRNVDTKRKVNEGPEDKRIDTEQESFTSRKMGYNTYEYLV